MGVVGLKAIIGDAVSARSLFSPCNLFFILTGMNYVIRLPSNATKISKLHITESNCFCMLQVFFSFFKCLEGLCIEGGLYSVEESF